MPRAHYRTCTQKGSLTFVEFTFIPIVKSSIINCDCPVPTLSLHLTSEQSLYKRATNLIARKWALITSPILTSFKEASHSSPRLALLKYFLLFSQAKNLQLCLPCPPPTLSLCPIWFINIQVISFLWKVSPACLLSNVLALIPSTD